MKRLNYACLIGSIACLASACSEQAPENTSSDITDTLTVNIPQAIPQTLQSALPLAMQTDGVVTAFTMLSENAGPTTISIASDDSIWYTLSSGNAIGRMNPDGSNMVEYPIPTPGSSPRIIAVGADGNMWFSEHEGNKMGRITPIGEITEFPFLSENSQP